MMKCAATAAALLALAGPCAATDACLAPSAVADSDVTRNAGVLGQGGGLCLSQLAVAENGLDWHFTLIGNQNAPDGPTIYLPHDDEDQAFDAALYGVRKYGGRLVAVENAEARVFNGQDPNRNFGHLRRGTFRCKDMHTRPAPLFTLALMGLRGGAPDFVLSLHNNGDGYGGANSISAAHTGGGRTGLLAPGGADEDDAILLAGRQPFGANKAAQGMVAALHKRGINAIYEHVVSTRNDCSLSYYVLLNSIAPYYNIEAQHGHLTQQKAMLDALMQIEHIKVRDASVK